MLKLESYSYPTDILRIVILDAHVCARLPYDNTLKFYVPDNALMVDFCRYSNILHGVAAMF